MDDELPEPPSGIVVRDADGNYYELDATLRYDGLDNDGIHLWTAYGPPYLSWRMPDELPRTSVAALPGNTSLAVPMELAPNGRYRYRQPSTP